MVRWNNLVIIDSNRRSTTLRVVSVPSVDFDGTREVTFRAEGMGLSTSQASVRNPVWIGGSITTKCGLLPPARSDLCWPLLTAANIKRPALSLEFKSTKTLVCQNVV